MGVAQARKEVKEDTVCKCFRSARILGSAMDVVSCVMDEEDPFADIDDSAQISRVSLRKYCLRQRDVM